MCAYMESKTMTNKETVLSHALSQQHQNTAKKNMTAYAASAADLVWTAVPLGIPMEIIFACARLLHRKRSVVEGATQLVGQE